MERTSPTPPGAPEESAAASTRAARPTLALLDYGMGNLRSVARAWEHVGAAVRIIDDPDGAQSADALVFPGQGAIVDTMERLRETKLDRLIRDWVAADRPFFGICLGLQALFTHSEEGDTPGLDIFPGYVRRFRPDPLAGIKVPHMGWNSVCFPRATDALGPHPPPTAQFYFVHSYFAEPAHPELVFGETDYAGLTFCSAIARGRLVATQFHPEKSQQAGLDLYRRFLDAL